MDAVEILLELKNVAQFVRGASEASGAIGKVGTTAEETGKKASSGWKGLAKWAGGAAALYGVTRFAKGATDATVNLAKSSMALSRTTGMNIETSSEFSALLQERGVSTKQAQTSLVKFSKAIETARQGDLKAASTTKDLRDQIDQVATIGGKKAPAELAKLSNAITKAQQAGAKARLPLQQLGVTQADLAHGDTEQVLLRVATGLQGMHDATARAVAVQQLFGRGGQALLPILMQGAAGVHKLLQEQKDSGNYISGKGVKSAKSMIETQRALDRTVNGLKIQFGEALLPVLVQVGKVLLAMSKFLQPLTKNTTLFTLAIGALTAAFVAYKAAMVVATIQQMEFNAAALANPVGLIIVGVVALIAGLVILYKKWGAFRDLINATWQWIKANWPLLLAILIGPFAVAALEIYKHWAAIKQGAMDVFNAIKNAAPAVAGAVARAFTNAFNTVKGVINMLIRGWNSLKFTMPKINTHIPGVGKIGGWTVGVPQIPTLAQGGVVAHGGTALVGERGPELVALPAGAAVHPLPAGGPARDLVITVPVVVDRRELARATARVASDRLARR